MEITPETATIIVAIIAGIAGSGGIVAAVKVRAEHKMSQQKHRLDEFAIALDGFKDLLSAEREKRKCLEERVDDMEVKAAMSEAYVDILVQHINDELPPPPPPRPVFE